MRCWLLLGGSPPQRIDDASSEKERKKKKILDHPLEKGRTGHGRGTQNITVNNTQTPWAAHGIGPPWPLASGRKVSSCGMNVPILALRRSEVSLCPHRSPRGSSPAGDALAAWHKGSDADAPQRPHPTAQSPSRVRTCPSAPGFGAAVGELLQKVTASPGSCLWCEEGGEQP